MARTRKQCEYVHAPSQTVKGSLTCILFHPASIGIAYVVWGVCGRRLRDAEGAEAPGTPTAEAARRPRGSAAEPNLAGSEAAEHDLAAPSPAMPGESAPAVDGALLGAHAEAAAQADSAAGAEPVAAPPATSEAVAEPDQAAVGQAGARAVAGELQRLQAECAALAQQVCRLDCAWEVK